MEIDVSIFKYKKWENFEFILNIKVNGYEKYFDFLKFKVSELRIYFKI